MTFMIATDNPLKLSTVPAATLQKHTILMIQCRIESPVSAFGDTPTNIC